MWTFSVSPTDPSDVTLTLEDPMVLALLACSQAHDERTQAHTMRVADWALALGSAWGLDAAALERVALAAALHDVGKIAVPAAILNKPGPLTAEEYEVMRGHAEATRHILERLPWPESERQIPHLAASHHEKWDGSGYPRGLAGEEIPLEARIIAIADVYDALISDRVYRPAMSQEQACALMASQGGHSFDPGLLRCFLETVQPRQASANVTARGRKDCLVPA